MTEDETKKLLKDIGEVVDRRIEKAESEKLFRKSGKPDWIHIGLLAGFTITNILVLFAHGSLRVALEKIDHLESIVSAASKLAL